MMDNDFKFENIGKQTPYRTPEDFFERMQTQLMEQTQGERRRQFRLKAAFATVLSMAALLAGCLFLLPKQQPTEELPSHTFAVSSTGTNASYSEQIDRYVRSMSDEELAEWIEFSENDIFMNLN